MSRPWLWQGLHRDGKPVLYEVGEPKRRLVRGERDMTAADGRLIAAAPELLEWMRNVLLTDFTGLREEEAKAIIRRIEGG